MFAEGAGGGTQQRMKRLRENTTPQDSELVRELLRDVVWGVISPQMFQKYCKLAAADVQVAVNTRDPAFRFADLEKFGGLDDGGNYPNNVWEDFVTAVKPPHFHDPGYFRPPMGGTKSTDQVRHVSQKINDPHALVAQMFEFYQQVCFSVRHYETNDRLLNLVYKQKHPPYTYQFALSLSQS